MSLLLASTLICGALVSLNMLLVHSPALGRVFGALYVYLTIRLVGNRLSPLPGRSRMLFGTIALLCALAVIGAAFIYSAKWNAASIALVLIVLPVVAHLVPVRTVAYPTTQTPRGYTRLHVISFLIVALDAVLLYTAFTHRTALPIRSPFEAISIQWLFLFAAASFFIFWQLARGRRVGLPILSLHTFVFLSLALIVYKEGFGFDPFVHQATEDAIRAHGTIAPRVPYYMGQYALVVFFSHLLTIAPRTIDLLLVPVLGALCIPALFSFVWRYALRAPDHSARAAALIPFVVPLAPFVVTTPQGLANLCALLASALGIAYLKDMPRALPVMLLLAAAALVTHPLTGVPTGLFVLVLYFEKKRRFKKIFLVPLILVLALAMVSLPILFTIAHHARLVAVLETFKDAARTIAPPSFAGVSPVSLHLDLLYTYKLLLPPIVVATILIGAVLLSRRGVRGALLYPIFVIALMVNAALVRAGVTFPFVIDYEQQNYALRVSELGLILGLPLVVTTLTAIGERAARVPRPMTVRWTLIAACAGLTAGGLYFSYPRVNTVEMSHLWSTSAADRSAVRTAEGDASGAPYVALANQAVSAAALREFGIDRHVKTSRGEFYFYPIPTGGPLYALYLDMVYGTPSRATVEEAMRMAGVERAYFMLNSYWWNAKKIVAATAPIADATFATDADRVIIFRFDEPKK